MAVAMRFHPVLQIEDPQGRHSVDAYKLAFLEPTDRNPSLEFPAPRRRELRLTNTVWQHFI